MPLGFAVEASRPFEVAGCSSSFPDLPDDLGALQSRTKRTLDGRDITVLPPKENVDVAIRFKPAKVSDDDTERVDYVSQGLLHIHYNNGEKQEYPLRAHMVHPALTSNKAFVHFNAVHVRSPKSMELVLTNAQAADAHWVAVSEGEKPVFGSNGTTGAAEPTELGVFTVSPGAGVLVGAGLENPKQQRVLITLNPPSDGTFERRIRFAVRKGRGFTVHVVGEGVYDEHLENQAKLKLLN